MKGYIVAGGLGLALAWGSPALAEERDVLDDGRLQAMAVNDPQLDPCDPRLMSGERPGTGGAGEAARTEHRELRDQSRAEHRELRDAARAEHRQLRDEARAEQWQLRDDARAEQRELRDRDLAELEVTQVQMVEPRRERGTRTYVLLGGGVDGYTQQLNHDLNPGPGWGVTLGVGGKVVGLEGAYSGAANQVDSRLGPTDGSGVDALRHGGHAAVKLNLSPTPLHPYILGGVGIEHRNFRNGEELGFQSGTNGYIPAAAGLHWNLGAFTADLRVSYNFLFEDDFAPGNPTGDRYQGTLMIGGTL